MDCVAVCEDSSIELEIVMKFLKRYEAERCNRPIHARGFCSGRELLKAVQAGEFYDLFLLDIYMPGIDGIEIARFLRESGRDADIVFLTSSTDHALDAFDVHAMQYLLKPITDETIFPVLDASFGKLSNRRDGLLLFNMPESSVKVPFSSIMCMESAYRKHNLYLADGRVLTSKSVRVPLSEVIAPLLTDARFLYAHKSYVLNMEHVSEIKAGSFVMKGGMIIHIPRYRFNDAKGTYLAYINEHCPYVRKE